jgi:feruloyl esterase
MRTESDQRANARSGGRAPRHARAEAVVAIAGGAPTPCAVTRVIVTRMAAVAAALSVGAAAVGTVGVGGRHVRAAPVAPVVAHCAALEGTRIPANAIGLPTHGATVLTATLVLATQHGNRNGEYCRITGVIHAVKDSTPDIRFQLNLPTRWNGRALQLGGGGYSGQVVSGIEPAPFAPNAAPLAQGYATFGSDSGHVGNSGRADFGANDEAVANFGYGHLKKTHDVALALIAFGYGRMPDKTYFFGGSTGGREGYTVIQRFPADYDGVVANAPAIDFTGVRLMGVKLGQAVYRSAGGFVSPAQQRYVHETVMRACDPLDGATDGIVSNVEACRKREAAVIHALRCDHTGADGDGDGHGQGEGKNQGEGVCLSDAQLATLEVLRDGVKLPRPLAYGVQHYAGYNVFEGANFSSPLGLGASDKAAYPLSFAANGYLFAQGDAYIKYFIAHDDSFNSLDFNLDKPGRYWRRVNALSATVGAMNPDMSAFIARGGKLITLQGLADEVISPNQTIAFYRAVVAQYGQRTVDSFMRLYMVPGFQHGNGAFIPAWDALGAIDGWVTRGVAPQTLIATDLAAATNGRSRPLCRYPAFPRYAGKGNINDAANFRCATS